MKSEFSPSRRAWNVIMTALVWAAAVLVIALTVGVIGLEMCIRDRNSTVSSPKPVMVAVYSTALPSQRMTVSPSLPRITRERWWEMCIRDRRKAAFQTL